MSRIFEPFFTTKGQTRARVWDCRLCTASCGATTAPSPVYSQPGEGTTFHLYFPAIGGEAIDLNETGATVPKGDGRRVLFVDDEEAIVRLAEKMLTRLGYTVETNTKVVDALGLVRADPDRLNWSSRI